MPVATSDRSPNHPKTARSLTSDFEPLVPQSAPGCGDMVLGPCMTWNIPHVHSGWQPRHGEQGPQKPFEPT